MNAWTQSPFFGVVLTIFAYWVGTIVQRKTRLAICNSIVIAALLILVTVKVLGIPLENYFAGGDLIHMMLGPATTCLAVSIYHKRELLKKYWIPVLVGCLTSVVVHFVCILVLCRAFGLERAMLMSLLPKSVTNPIATAISQEHGGIMSITVAAVIFAGVLGNLTGPTLAKVFRIKDPMATGLGIGACSHAIGTAKAVELGETEGALSGLAIGICGIMTAVLALGFGMIS